MTVWEIVPQPPHDGADIGAVRSRAARATVDGRSIPTLVVFGEEGADPLLGAYTLEGLRLAVDPVKLTLVPLPYAWA